MVLGGMFTQTERAESNKTMWCTYERSTAHQARNCRRVAGPIKPEAQWNRLTDGVFHLISTRQLSACFCVILLGLGWVGSFRQASEDLARDIYLLYFLC